MNTDPSLLKILLLLSFWSPAGATTASSQQYRRKNGSFCLRAAASPPYDGSLSFKKKVVFHNNKTSTAYKSRVDYDQKTFEWCLRQLTETDSGSYKFTVMKNDTVQEQSYSLVVEEAVPRPVIRTSALTSNLSAGLCNVTVNCSVWGDWVSSVCNESVCQTSGGSLTTVRITVSTGSRSVTCSGSNFVSTSNSSEAICLGDRPTPEEEELFLYIRLLGWLGLPVLLIALLAFLFKVLTKHQKKTRPPRKIQPGGAARAPSVSSRVSNVSSQSEVAYENVDAVPSGQDRGVETVYNQVGRRRAASDGTEAQDAKNPGEVETVYSVLQKV